MAFSEKILHPHRGEGSAPRVPHAVGHGRDDPGYASGFLVFQQRRRRRPPQDAGSGARVWVRGCAAGCVAVCRGDTLGNAFFPPLFRVPRWRLVELTCDAVRTGTLSPGTPRWFRPAARRSASRAGVGTSSGLPRLSGRGCLSARTQRSTILSGLSWLGEFRSSETADNLEFDLTQSTRGVIGPYLVATGAAFGSERHGTGLVSYIDFSDAFTKADHPSPRFWLLGPGVACMVAVSLTGMVPGDSKTFPKC